MLRRVRGYHPRDAVGGMFAAQPLEGCSPRVSNWKLGSVSAHCMSVDEASISPGWPCAAIRDARTTLRLSETESAVAHVGPGRESAPMFRFLSQVTRSLAGVALNAPAARRPLVIASQSRYLLRRPPIEQKGGRSVKPGSSNEMTGPEGLSPKRHVAHIDEFEVEAVDRGRRLSNRPVPTRVENFVRVLTTLCNGAHGPTAVASSDARNRACQLANAPVRRPRR